VDVLFEATPPLAVVAERVEGCRRNGIDGVGADEGLYVQDVPEARILGARARPQETLHPSATSGQGLPARAAGELLPILIGELRVGDGHLADEAAQLGLV